LQIVDLTLKVFNCLKRTAEEVVSVKDAAKIKNVLPIKVVSEDLASSEISWQRRGLVVPSLSLFQTVIHQSSHFNFGAAH
jgi:hypothetical protein